MVTNSVSCSQTVRFPHVRAEDLNLTVRSLDREGDKLVSGWLLYLGHQFCCNRWCGSQPKGYTSRRQYRKDLTTCGKMMMMTV
ncbi:unnamed protein product [Fusarium graminearum]|nr:unnamed protein product [Fusarium graminearum]CAG1966896.1 unnamed protein product [Fusarium graminearum]CAG1990673.1 unnamed protein product [Fusarium graminearum]VTO91045.1 unnamed protein product [Fusarium graminearum]